MQVIETNIVNVDEGAKKRPLQGGGVGGRVRTGQIPDRLDRGLAHTHVHISIVRQSEVIICKPDCVSQRPYGTLNRAMTLTQSFTLPPQRAKTARRGPRPWAIIIPSLREEQRRFPLQPFCDCSVQSPIPA